MVGLFSGKEDRDSIKEETEDIIVNLASTGGKVTIRVPAVDKKTGAAVMDDDGKTTRMEDVEIRVKFVICGDMKVSCDGVVSALFTFCVRVHKIVLFFRGRGFIIITPH